MKILSIFGTRPEAIKMAPVIRELERHSKTDRVSSCICVTAQHRQMLDQVLDLFQLRPDIDLNLMERKQTIAALTARTLTAVTAVLQSTKPDRVLVQGDTTTAMAAALAAFYEKIPVGHIEAGLRTRNRYSPFPEELNRRAIDALAEHHFAPTSKAIENLKAEGVREEQIFLTGNTVMDALLWIANRRPSRAAANLLKRLGVCDREGERDHRHRTNGNGRFAPDGLNTILVTAHRRESFGEPLENICKSLRCILERNPDVQIVYPMHMNPQVQETARRILHGQERLHLIKPLPYEPFVQLMKRACLVLTDSGGIQEEAPSLGKPVLVLRRDTERPEAVEAGGARIVGTDPDRVVAETERLLRDPQAYERMAQCISPYGDGHAAERIVNAILCGRASAAAQ
jgi:UDP-N-acetylglucosamine 2-epimerase